MRGTTVAVDLVTIRSLVTTGVVDLAATALTIKLNVPDKTNWTIRGKTVEGSCDVKIPLGNIEDFRFAFLCMFLQV